MLLFHLSVTVPSSPTLSSAGASRCFGPTGTGAEEEGRPVGCDWVVELILCTVWAGWDEKVAVGSVAGGFLSSVVETWCRGVGLCAIGVDERLRAPAESVDVRVVLYQFKTVQRILQSKWSTHTHTHTHHPAHYSRVTPTDITAHTPAVMLLLSASTCVHQHPAWHTLFVFSCMDSTAQ